MDELLESIKRENEVARWDREGSKRFLKGFWWGLCLSVVFLWGPLLWWVLG